MDRTNFIWNFLDNFIWNFLDNNQSFIVSKWASVINQLNNSLIALKRISVIDIVHFSKLKSRYKARYKVIRDLI